MGILDKLLRRPAEAPAKPVEKPEPVAPKTTERLPLSELDNLDAHMPGDNFRRDMFKEARRIGAECHVDNQDLGVVAFLVDTDEQLEELLRAFEAQKYPRGEFKKSDDGGSLGSGEVNWEDAGRNRLIVRVVVRPEHKKSSGAFFLHTLDATYQ